MSVTALAFMIGSWGIILVLTLTSVGTIIKNSKK
jgi:hypothetical protein